MNINATSSSELHETQTTSSSSKQNEEKQSFYDEYSQLLQLNGLNLGINEQNLLQSYMTLSGTNNESTLLNYATGLKNIKSSFNYDSMSISKEDAMFFADIVEKTDYVIADNKNASFSSTLLKVAMTDDTQTLKSTEVSKALMNLIEEAYKTQKPTRIDFDNNVSVILRITKDGKVSAEFIPGDKAVEEYLRNNIGYLKQRFDEENISYHDIMYKPYKNNNKRQNQNKGGQQ